MPLIPPKPQPKPKPKPKKTPTRATRLVVLSARWCGACQDLKPVLAKLEAAHGIEVEVIDFGRNKKRALDYLGLAREEDGDIWLPTLIAFDGAQKLWVTDGYYSASELGRKLGLPPLKAAKKP